MNPVVGLGLATVGITVPVNRRDYPEIPVKQRGFFCIGENIFFLTGG